MGLEVVLMMSGVCLSSIWNKECRKMRGTSEEELKVVRCCWVLRAEIKAGTQMESMWWLVKVVGGGESSGMM